KRIALENIFSETSGDVLIAGLNDAHRTEVSVKNVVVQGITAKQVHLKYADLRVSGSNIPFAAAADTTVVVKSEGGAVGAGDVCAGKFVAYR
ncbi:MAG: glycoside hydrolase, partial [Bryocella sp.]